VSKVEDWVKHETEEEIRAKGKMQKYGKDYVMQDNDVVFFRHSAK